MNNLLNYAKNELDLHALLVPDSVITPFKKEILALCETFGDSGQSGGSAPFVVSALTKTINNLLSYKPLNPITGNNEEWNDIMKNIETTVSFKARTEKEAQRKRMKYQEEMENRDDSIGLFLIGDLIEIKEIT